jgi:riboflavin synthase
MCSWKDMFTGLIESVGEIAEIAPVVAGFNLRIMTDVAAELGLGESVAVNGVCLTVVDANTEAGSFSAEIGPETARVTSLGTLARGSRVNLERAMPANGRFGGHIVLGHVDGTGTIQSIRPEADFWWITIGFPASLAPYLIHRGSIAVDGVSLTIAKLEPTTFDVQIVPFTWSHTNLGSLRAGDRVNLECDMVGKYVLRAVETLGVAQDFSPARKK